MAKIEHLDPIGVPLGDYAQRAMCLLKFLAERKGAYCFADLPIHLCVDAAFSLSDVLVGAHQRSKVSILSESTLYLRIDRVMH